MNYILLYFTLVHLLVDVLNVRIRTV